MFIGNPYARRSADDSPARDFESLTEDDLDCPICIEMVNEPVRLRCNHILCRECFERLLELSSRKCPKCRRWIGSARHISDWLDNKLWAFIKRKFLEPRQAVQHQIKADRAFALSMIRRERREQYFRGSPYTLRSSRGSTSTLDASISTEASSTSVNDIDLNEN